MKHQILPFLNLCMFQEYIYAPFILLLDFGLLFEV